MSASRRPLLSSRHGSFRRAAIGLITTAVLATGLGAGLVPAGALGVPLPDGDGFYRAPNPFPAVADGTVLRSRSVSVTAAGLPLKVHAWQLLYASRDTDGRQVADAATVLLPDKAAATRPRPLVSYHVAEDSLTTRCAPSYELRTGNEAETPLILSALDQGWAVIVPDYEGPRSQWTAAVQEGHAVLDGVRAAESFRPLRLAGTATPVGLWGYSGGGQASAWASELQPSYAPELHLAGVAEGGVPVNVADVARKINGGAFVGIYFGAAVGLNRAYPQLIDAATLLNARGRKMFAEVGAECLNEFVARHPFQRMEQFTAGGVDPLTRPGVQQVVADVALGQRRPSAPIYLYMSQRDQLIPVADDDTLVRSYCAMGVRVEYVRDQVSEHISLTAIGASAAINYLRDRFAGKPVPDNCATGGTDVVSAQATPSNLVTLLTMLAGLAGFL